MATQVQNQCPEPLPDFKALTLSEYNVKAPTTTLEQPTDKAFEDQNGEDHTALHKQGLTNGYELDLYNKQVQSRVVDVKDNAKPTDSVTTQIMTNVNCGAAGNEAVASETIRQTSKPSESVAITIADQVSENAMEESVNMQDLNQPKYKFTLENDYSQPNISQNQREQETGENNQEIGEDQQETPRMSGNTNDYRRSSVQDQERGLQPQLNNTSRQSNISVSHTSQQNDTGQPCKSDQCNMKVCVALAIALVLVIWGGVATHKNRVLTTQLEVLNQKIEALKDERGKLIEELAIATQCQDYSAPGRHPIPCDLGGSRNLTFEGTPKSYLAENTTTGLIPKNCLESRNWILQKPKCFTETGNSSMLQLGQPNPDCPDELQYFCICTGKHSHHVRERDCQMEYTTVPKK